MTPNPCFVSPDATETLVFRLPHSLQAALRQFPNQVFVYGGWIRSVVMQQQPNDIDLCCSSKATLLQLVERLGRYIQINEGKKVIMGRLEGWTVQVSHQRFCPTYTRVLAMGDFTVCRACMFYDDSTGGFRVAVDPQFFADAAFKRLRYVSARDKQDVNALASVLRALRFAKEGMQADIDSLKAVISEMILQVTTAQENPLSPDSLRAKVSELIDEALPIGHPGKYHGLE